MYIKNIFGKKIAIDPTRIHNVQYQRIPNQHKAISFPINSVTHDYHTHKMENLF